MEQGFDPSAPVKNFPVYAIAGGFELRDVIGPAMIDLVVNMGLLVAVARACPRIFDQLLRSNRMFRARRLKD